MLRALQRFFRTGLVTVVLATLVASPLTVAAQASQTGAPINLPATGAGFPVVLVGGDLHRLAENAYGSVWTNITRAVLVAFFNGAQLFFGQLAYDAANAIATAGTGQQPVFYKKGFDNYIRDVAADAAGDFMGSLSNEQFFRTLGFNLCRPSTGDRGLLRIQMSLGNFFPGLQGRFERPRPRCEWQQVVSNWNTFGTTLSQTDVFKAVDFSFNPNANDIGIATGIFNFSAASVQEKLTAQLLQRQEGRGIRSVSNIITGDIRTPADLVRESTAESVIRQPNATQRELVGAVFTTGMQQGALQLLQYTASMFVNTLASKLMRRVFETGVAGNIDLPRSVASPDVITTAGKTDVRNANIDLRTPNLFRVATFDAMADLVACPENSRGTWNCVMDQSLAQALQKQGEQGAMTIREAMERNYLHGDWRLIPSTKVRENTDPLCHTYAYCAGNLAKLRMLRVLPVGLEFAANSPENISRCASAQGCVTLREVVQGFQDCENGARSASKQWCHLVDPNWVITLPQQQCAMKGYSDVLLTSQLGQRKEECSDVQTCLKRNDRGECVGGYGYCVAEKTVYRFGADECPAQFNSCRQYKSRSGATVGYLRTTLDFGQCSAENAGCMWYATERVATTAGAWVGTTTTGPRVYLDKTMESCSAQDDGCTQVRRVAIGEPALNLVPNSSFENLTTDTPAQQSAWRWSAGGVDVTRAYREPVVASGPTFVHGTKAQELTTESEVAYQLLRVGGERVYTLSAYIRAKNAARTATFRAVLNEHEDVSGTDAIRRDDGGPMGRLYRSPGCTVSAVDRTARIGVDNGTGAYDSWTRVQCSFLTTSSTRAGTLSLLGRDMLVDAVELEESEFPTEYVESMAEDLAVTHIKLPPEELRCTGAAGEPGACANFARVCRQADAGCDQYTDRETTEQVNAVATTNDLCPATCAGYAEYRKMASSFDLVRDLDGRFDDPEDASSTFMIPSRGELCRAEEVGCEEFTNVESAGTGGEQKAYFTYTRSCRKPGPDATTYFTWEGSDVAGYQLRSYSLVRADAGTAPRIVIKRQPGDLYYKEPTECNARSWARQDDPDCRQFYDANGTTYYRYLSQTVLSTPACQTFRLAITNRADCEKTDGQYNAGANECLYQVFVPESQSCRAQAAGCRAYAGARAGNAQSLLSQTFRSATGTFVGGRLSNESLIFGDQSLRVDVAAGREAEAAVPVLGTNENELYQVTFYAKAVNPATVEVRAVNRDGGSENNLINTVSLSPDWQRFTVGPFKGIMGEATTTLAFRVTSRPAGQVVFLDEVNVVGLQDVVYALEDSWTVPAECNRTQSGAELPQAMLGCRAYTNRNNQEVHLKSFSRLCRANAVGCTAFIDTRNSASPYAQSFTRGDSPAGSLGYPTATTTRLGDRYVYVIDDPAKRCRAENASCRAFGKPVFTADRQNIQDFQTVYLKDDITKYEAGLCKPSELFCEEFEAKGGKEYFRDPQNHACEYRTDVQNVPGFAASTKYSGWFVKGTPATPCYPNLLVGGGSFNVALRGDRDYAGWGATCGQQYAECTEFRDTNDKDRLYPSGRPYYFLKNEKMDTQSCNGQVDPAKGCILMRDTTNQTVNYSTQASYKKFESAGSNNPVSPMNCSGGGEGCPTTRVCRGTITSFAAYNQTRGFGIGAPTVSSNQTYGSCTSDADCVATEVTNCAVVGAAEFGANPGETVCRTWRRTNGTCQAPVPFNDANLIVKAKIDRDCAQWLGCSTAETVLDPATNRYTDICTNLALCDETSKSENDIFCAHYVDRSSTTTEPIMTRGAFFDINRYVGRQVGLGQKDYTGYAIPNAFQVPDFQTRRVGVEASSEDREAEYKYRLALDYRLVAAVPIRNAKTNLAAGAVEGRLVYESRRNPGPDEAVIIRRDAAGDLGRRYPLLDLCRHVATGRVGYFNAKDIDPVLSKDINCYLPVRDTKSSPTAVDNLDFQNLYQKFALENPNADRELMRGYPGAECRANPESDSPFQASFVTGWNDSVVPPKATGKQRGYQAANTCEKGEDCSCTYKRVEYLGAVTSKFYNSLSENIPPGLCQGGPRDGQICLPESVYRAPSAADASTPEGQARAAAIAEANAKYTCGPLEGGGRCVPFSRVTLVRGIFGQCLERDVTRSLGDDQGNYPCLTWNPTPILFGDKDNFHYDPRTGYQPPQNSGQYYCLSQTRAPSSIRLNNTHFHATPYAGAISKLDYSEDYVRGNDICSLVLNTCTQNKPGSYLDDSSRRPEDTPNFNDCKEAAGFQRYQSTKEDASALRLINTGRYSDKSYTETFFKINPQRFTDLLQAGAAVGSERQDLATRDTTISYLKISAMGNPNGTGRLACGYQSDWVDGIESPDYGNEEQLKAAERQWREKFEQEFKGIIARGTEKFLATSDGNGAPFLLNCVDTADAGVSTSRDQKCFFKTWEVGYRAQSQRAFIAPYEINSSGEINRESILNTSTPAEDDDFTFERLRAEPYYASCDADKPYFSIRAVFQAKAKKNAGGNWITPTNTNAIETPWNLVGFWVTTCGGKANDYRWMYVHVDVNAADTCRELAEVRSKDSRDNAAFTDRVWKESGFVVPELGIQYGERYAPFSSALNVKPAGKDPLFMTGGEYVSLSSQDASFIGSGYRTFFNQKGAGVPPRDQWANLSNLFARIYRVYQFNEQPITASDKICVNQGRLAGKKCDTNTQCQIQGQCQQSAITETERKSLKFCNALSGINAGLPCNATSDQNDLCHQAPLARDSASGDYQPLREACKVNLAAGWSKAGNGYTNARLTGEDARRTFETRDAASRGAFVCDSGSLRAGQPCSAEATESTQCPTKVTGKCVKPNVYCLNSLRGGSKYTGSVTFEQGRCSITGSSKAIAALKAERQPDLIPVPSEVSARLGIRCAAGETPYYSFDDLTLSVWQNGSEIQYRQQHNLVGAEHAGCFQDTDCNFDEWNMWSTENVPYLKRNTGASERSAANDRFYTEDVGGYLWGPIYSVRSAVNRERTELPGQPSALRTCLVAHDESGSRWINPTPGSANISLCLGAIPMNKAQLQGGYPGYGTGNCTLGGGSGCPGPHLYGPVGSLSGRLVATVWNSDASRPGLWPRNFTYQYDTIPGSNPPQPICQTGAGGAQVPPTDEQRDAGFTCAPQNWRRVDLDNRLPFLRHRDELIRAPGVGEAGKGKPNASNIRTAVTRAPLTSTDNNGTDDGNFYLNLAKCEAVDDMAKVMEAPSVEGFNKSGSILATDGGTSNHYGRCAGGVNEGRLCRVSDNATVSGGSATQRFVPSVSTESPYSCDVPNATPQERTGSCVNVTDVSNTSIRARCFAPGTSPTAAQASDPEFNFCLRPAGYTPRIDLCANPEDEYCGLFAFNPASRESYDPRGTAPLPTDVTVGHYTPLFLGNTDFAAKDYRHVAYYTPKPPRIAAPDIRNCASPGQCPILSLDKFSLDGSTEGVTTVVGGQHKSTVRFYAWAAHDQMPLRRLVMDWGDGKRLELPDAKLKNHKPFCGVQKECWLDPVRGHTGLTCSTDVDCPPGGGTCQPIGTCARRPHVSCRMDDDCTEGVGPTAQRDTCKVRTFFGNNADACEDNYFEFTHAYSCTARSASLLPRCDAPENTATVPSDVQAGRCYFGAQDQFFMDGPFSGGRPACTTNDDCGRLYSNNGGPDQPSDVGVICGVPTTAGRPATPILGRCSRDTSRACDPSRPATTQCAAGDSCVATILAPPGGCWDATAQSCRFTPRIILEDNWGWCTGECRDTLAGGNVVNSASASVRHPNGGCYAGQPLLATSDESKVKRNNLLGASSGSELVPIRSQCEAVNPNPDLPSNRPWMVYQGSLLLRAR